MRTRRVPRATMRPRGRWEVLPASSVGGVLVGDVGDRMGGGKGEEGDEGEGRGREGGLEGRGRGGGKGRGRAVEEFLDVVEDEVHELVVAFEGSCYWVMLALPSVSNESMGPTYLPSLH